MTTMAEFWNVIFTGKNLAVLGVALATLLSGMGSAKGVNLVGKAASGLLSEDPTKFGKAMALLALPMTQGIYGLITSFLIMIQIGVFGGGAVEVTLADGAYYLLASLPIAIVGLYSGIKQGEVAASGISVIAKRPDQLGKAIMTAALVETYAIFAVLVSIMLVFMH